MKIPSYVRSYPFIFRPITKIATASSWYPWIFVNDTVFADLQKENPSSKSVAALLHEGYHRKRQIEMGWLRFGLGYVFSREFRLDEELKAYEITKKIYQENNIVFDIQKIARALSGFPYLWLQTINTRHIGFKNCNFFISISEML